MSEYKTVPVEPTEEMLEAADGILRQEPAIKGFFKRVYKAMIAAAPSAVSEELLALVDSWRKMHKDATGPCCHDMCADELTAILERMPNGVDELAALESEVRAELLRAIEKFPTWPTDPIHAAMVVAEESGELMKDVLQAVYEPGKKGDVRAEAIQTTAMCLRFLLSLDRYEFEPGAQHESSFNAARSGGGGE